MKVISRSKMAQEKVKTLQSGYTAFAETKELSERLRQELHNLGIDYIEESTNVGSWFIPKK
ncbi:hypothetical protein CR194_11370 [Salipaludibacillus keqinensis]|uniref:Uncharacterized protein n=1 Tax=Salipaludibacillus keqinensis TaxID=2045207 RepID=A0A323THV2_9BACI|nr:hypothetical protein [Salipaludibacillus keqinensis]PYZ93746.1 hypothetical protein CR194_11370 [Salipaludibacillus keqinensis]